MRLLIAATALVALTLGFVLGHAIGISQRDAAWADTDRAHAGSDAALQIVCGDVAAASRRVQVRASEHLWRHMGPTGGALPLAPRREEAAHETPVAEDAGQRSGTAERARAGR